MKNHSIYYKRNLPDIILPESTLFITFRLKGSIPKQIVKRLKLMHEEKLHQIKGLQSKDYEEAKFKEDERYFLEFDNYLDMNRNGPHYLTQPLVRKIMIQHLTKLHSLEYDLLAYCIMSNHVHLLFKLYPHSKSFCEIMQSIKGASAFYINRQIGRRGTLWQAESFDRYIRNEQHFNSTVAYILNNPAKAGIVEEWERYPGTYLKNY